MGCGLSKHNIIYSSPRPSFVFLAIVDDIGHQHQTKKEKARNRRHRSPPQCRGPSLTEEGDLDHVANDGEREGEFLKLKLPPATFNFETSDY